MKKKQVNTYLFNENTWKGIEITQSAAQQILLLINRDKKNTGIKLSIKKSGCAGFRYTMELTNNEKQLIVENDIIFSCKNISIQISKKDIPFLDGVKIDFIKNNVNKVFKFYNSKLEKFCGCGESFAIN
ncbi:hypothetical protein IX46_00630 [Buchnera aphidicola (Aphis glycines)]|uniref:Core domain-containing protein n=1 Tax=Buchnera aphidicola (Aphis glycines) TaxID=1265350 RepID=A0A0M4HDW8_9GAMM|nr:iron-sulfur cluster assembly accessory protein [Buchnera aphidicola]ALD15085.1 hypothetical protein IX46_00630 [Buchnera aphidicola (Aphis glycines)]